MTRKRNEIEQALKSKDWLGRCQIVYRDGASLTSEQIDTLLEDEHWTVRVAVGEAAHVELSPEQIKRGLQDEDPDIRAEWNKRLAEHIARTQARDSQGGHAARRSRRRL